MKKMAVHNGVFHADDVFCVALMQLIEEDLEVVRTRDVAILESCDIVADVGNGKYDHHQADKVLRPDEIPYSAFGLLWQDFGQVLIEKQCSNVLSEEQIQEIVQTIATEFITQIDAGDNGISLNTYTHPVTTLSQIISGFMPIERTNSKVDAAFFEATKLAKMLLIRMIYKYAKVYEDMDYMKQLLAQKEDFENHILVIEKDIKWKDILLALDPDEKIWFVVFSDITGSWRVQTVPKSEDSFEARKDLPKAWSGLRSEELTTLTGISGCIFCHPNLFIAGNDTKEGAIAMANLAVENARNDVIM